ncbi:MAG: ankyrin repeat domain-containing protein, partial [Treponemataceae bacterium]
MMVGKKKIVSLLGSIALAAGVSFFGCAGTQTRVEQSPKSVAEDDVFSLLEKGENAKAREFFKGRADINGADAKGRTPLHIAAIKKDPDLIVFLLSKGAKIDALDADGKTAMKIVYEADDDACVKVLAEAGSNIFFNEADAANTAQLLMANKKLLMTVLTAKNVNTVDKKGKTLLHFATIAADKDAVAIILGKSANVNAQDEKSDTSLDYAFSKPDSIEHIRVAETLILAGGRSKTELLAYCVPPIKTSNFDIRFEDGLSPLHFAAREGHLGVIKYLIEKKAKVDAKNASGAPPLQEAFRMGKLAAAELLIQAGANVNARDAKGNSAMHLVMPHSSRLAGLELLLANKADPNIKDDHGDSPLHVVVGTNLGIDVARKLIQNSADPNIRNTEGMTPLHTAVERDRLDYIPILLSNGGDVFAADLKGKTPFDLALEKGGTSLQAMITAATVAATDKEGNTQLHIAILRKADVRTIGLIIDQKAAVNARNMNGDTSLHLAVQADLREIGELLIARGADIFAVNASGKSPLYTAAYAKEGFRAWILNLTTIEAKDGLGNGILHYAASWTLDVVIPRLIQAGARTDAQNATGETPLFAAIKADSPSTISVLLAEGASSLARDSLGNTALHAAVRWNAKQAVAALIKGNADVNTGNLNGKTPLHESVRLGMADTEGLLIAAGALMEARDLLGNTPLMDAVQNGLSAAIERLLENGASLNVRNNSGDTPLHVAVKSQRLDIATGLLTKGA